MKKVTVQKLIEALKKLKPDEKPIIKFNESNTEKTMEISAIESNDEGIIIHGHIIMAVYGMVSEYEMQIAHIVAKNIKESGVIRDAITNIPTDGFQL